METSEQRKLPTQLEWGGQMRRFVPASAVVAWGARAIYHAYPLGIGLSSRPTVDLLWDRQGMAAGDDQWRLTLANWINDTVNDNLRSKLVGVYGSDDDIVSIDADRFHMRASPCRSYGYMYIVAWLDP